MNLTKNFTLEELTKSSTADAKHIDNTVPKELMANIKKLAEQLQVIRDEYGLPIVVSSGYRCEKLNKAVGGASNSDHRWACAADIHTKSDNPYENRKLFELITHLALKGKVELRQIIDEYNYNWVHVSINNDHNSYKYNQILHIR